MIGRNFVSKSFPRMMSIGAQITQIPVRLSRDGETVNVMRQRLVYQSRKRGILESDLLCSTFAQKYLHELDEPQLQLYDRLLDNNDWDLYYWASGQKQVPFEWDNEVMRMLI